MKSRGNKLIFIAVIFIVIKLLTCSSSKPELGVQYTKPLLKAHEKELYWFMPGIDDTCDTSKYNCIDMRKEYESRILQRK